jgi:hypothetical protein
MKFRKKPVVIEAVQLRWDNWGEMCDHADVGELADGHPMGCYVNEAGEGVDAYPGDYFDSKAKAFGSRIGLWIPTLEGVMLGIENDWIIRGVQGELYPCKPDIFEATYEAV